MIKMNHQSGFTLIEIAIVLLIVGILLGYTVALLPVQDDLKRYRQVEQDMDRIVAALVGFAQVNGRLPCPDTSVGGGTIDGSEDQIDTWNVPGGVAGTDGTMDACDSYYGLLPKVTLGINGGADANNNLIDPWGQPYRYAVTDVNADVAGSLDTIIDFVTQNEIRNEGLPAFIVGASPPDLVICNTAPAAAGNETDCDNAVEEVFINAVVVIVSTGKFFNARSNIEAENLESLHSATPNDTVFIETTRTDSTGAEFDDVIRWITPAELFTKMIAAEQLP